MQTLTQTLARCRAAIINAASRTVSTSALVTPGQTVAATTAVSALVTPDKMNTRRPPTPVIRRSRPAPPPPPAYTPLETLLEGHDLKAGPLRLLSLLYDVSTRTMTARGYRCLPSQVTIHQPQELLARALQVHYTTIWRWVKQLETAGLLDARPHYTTSDGHTRSDGTLFAVSLKAGHRAHLTHDDLSHQWRDLDADRAAGQTAWSVLQGSNTKSEVEWKDILVTWAVTPGKTEHPLKDDPCNTPQTVRDVVYMLPILAASHADKRPGLVGIMASTLAHALNDQHSRRYWCKVIWSAWDAELQGRHGLQQFAAQLDRLQADLIEWPELRNAGALLVSRLN